MRNCFDKETGLLTNQVKFVCVRVNRTGTKNLINIKFLENQIGVFEKHFPGLIVKEGDLYQIS